MANGIIYTRVSTKEQAEDRTSLATQEKECKSFARKNDVYIPDANVFIERGESAKFVERTELQRMLRFVRDKRNKVEILYIWKIDRLARNLGDYYGIKVALAKYGVRIVSVTEPIDDDPVGRFLEAILAAAAQFDNEIRTVRTVGGMRARVEQGGWPHQAPIGYKKVDKRVVVDPVFGPIIQEMLHKFSTGLYTPAEMTRFASEKGITTKNGSPKSVDQIQKILQNQLYSGYLKHKLSDKIVKGKHKALVDETVIHKNAELLAGTKKTFSWKGDDLFPLRGTLLCSNCHLSMTASTPHGNGGYYSRYTCGRKTCLASVTKKPATKDSDIVHKHFRELLESLRPLDGLTKLYKEILVRAWNDEYKHAIDSAEELNRNKVRYEQLRHSTMQKYIEDKITDEDKNQQLKWIDGELDSLNDEMMEMDTYIKDREKIIDDAMQFITAPDIFWNRANTAIRKDIQRLLFPNGIEYDFLTGFGTIESTNSYLLLQKIAAKNGDDFDLVGLSGPIWNLVRKELIAMYDIVRQVRQGTGVVA